MKNLQGSTGCCAIYRASYTTSYLGARTIETTFQKKRLSSRREKNCPVLSSVTEHGRPWATFLRLHKVF